MTELFITNLESRPNSKDDSPKDTDVASKFLNELNSEKYPFSVPVLMPDIVLNNVLNQVPAIAERIKSGKLDEETTDLLRILFERGKPGGLKSAVNAINNELKRSGSPFHLELSTRTEVRRIYDEMARPDWKTETYTEINLKNGDKSTSKLSLLHPERDFLHLC